MTGPSTIPGYGDVYAAWGEQAGLYGAKTQINKGLRNVELSTDTEFRSLNLVGEESQVRIQGLDTNNPVAFASAGLGVFFEPSPLWAISPHGYHLIRPVVEGEVDLDEAKRLDEQFPGGLYRGLSDTLASETLRQSSCLLSVRCGTATEPDHFMGRLVSALGL